MFFSVPVSVGLTVSINVAPPPVASVPTFQVTFVAPVLVVLVVTVPWLGVRRPRDNGDQTPDSCIDSRGYGVCPALASGSLMF